MEKSNASQQLTSSDSAWYLFAESSLIEFMSEIDRGDWLNASLIQKMQELDIPPQCVEKIEMTITDFAREVLAHHEQAKLELPGRIRVFCQKRLVNDSNLTKKSRPRPIERTMEPIQMIHHPGTRMYGGWGYFLIERGGNVFADSSLSSYHFVDLYLYKEG